MLRLIFVVAAIFIIAAILPIFPALQISSADASLCLPLREGEEFSIKYNHSVNHSPVIDTIERTGETLTINSSLFSTYGAGIPVLSDEVGDTYTETEEGFLLSGIDSEHRSISLLTGTYADHRLLYRQNELILKDTFGEMTLITFSIGKANLFELLI